MALRPTLFALMLLTIPLTGCLMDDAGPGSEAGSGEVDRPAAGRLACVPGEEVQAFWPSLSDPSLACDLQATVTPESRQANELSIAVNPLDPANMIASGKDYTPAYAGDCVWDGIYVTKDGGRTWDNANLPDSPGQRTEGDVQADGDFTRYWCATDPVLAFGPDGTAYWTVMPYQCDAASGSKTGRDVLPDGGLNDWFWTCSSMYVLVSEDGGETWPTVREVTFGPRLEHDKQWMSVAPDGTVLLCWDRDPSYQATGAAPGGNPAEQLTAAGYMVCSVSTDKGQSWSEVTDVNPEGTWDGFLPWVDWDGESNAWMAAIDSDGNVLVSRSDDGLAWDDPWVVGTYENPPPGGEYGWPVLEGSDFRTFALPSLAVDRTDGPHGGTVYVAWFDHSSGHGQVMLVTSPDGGETWTDPVRVRDEGPNSEHDQFMPAISVGPDGTVDLVWLDRRDDPENHLYTLYHAYSLDGGETWSENLRVGQALSDEQFSHHQNGMIFLGDYIDVDSSDGMAHPVWVDTRNEKADAFVANIERPSANAGMRAIR